MIKVPVNKVFRDYADQYLYDYTAVYLVSPAPLSRIPMHGMASDRHVMVGMAASQRIERGAARRGAAPLNFAAKAMRPRTERILFSQYDPESRVGGVEKIPLDPA